MNHQECDIWFGPGGLKGVFGAGVAAELQFAIQRGDIDPSKLRLFGSSVGCLTATYLATGNAENGIRVFLEDVQGLITPANLLPSLGARFANRVMRTAGGTQHAFRVPSVLNVDHALDVMMRRTPNVLSELRDAAMPAFAEYVHVRTGDFRHIDLQSSPQPLQVIRDSLSCFPFAWSRETDVLDAGIAGYGFLNLIRRGLRKLAVVLNSDPSPRMRDPLYGFASAVLAASGPISRLYLSRERNQRLAVQAAEQCTSRVVVIAPAGPTCLQNDSDFQRCYDEGRNAARRVIAFVHVPTSTGGQP